MFSIPVRRHRWSTQTAVDTYTHAQTGKTVTLVGVAHIGPAQYYAELQGLVDGLESQAEVQYELCRKPDPDEEMTDQERELVRRLLDSDQKALAPLLGMVTQSAMTYRDGWLNKDMTMLESLRLLPNPESIAKGHAELIEVLTAVRFARWCALQMMKYSGLLVLISAGSQKLSSKGRATRAVIMDMRNDIASQAAVDAPGNVVSIWGAEHLIGIGKRLRRSGYRRTGRSWYTCVPRGHRVPENLPTEVVAEGA